MSEKTSKTAAKPARSPVERAIVWSVIGIGLLVIGVEAKAHFAHSAAMNTLNQKLKDANESETDKALTKAEVETVVGSQKPESSELDPRATSIGAKWLDVYEYKGLVKTRKLYVYYGVEVKGQSAEVLYVSSSPAETRDEADAKAPVPPEPDPNPMNLLKPKGGAAGPGPGPAGMGLGGMGPGGPGPAAPGRRGTGGAGGPGGRPEVDDDAAKASPAPKAAPSIPPPKDDAK